MTPVVGDPGRQVEARMLDGMLLQRGRLMEVLASMRTGDLTPLEARSYLGLVRDNLAAIRKAVHQPIGVSHPGERLIAPLEHVRNRLFDLLGGLRRGELTDQHAADYLVMISASLASIQKAARALR